MRANSLADTPFEKGKRAAQAGAALGNPFAEGSVEHRNYELGRQHGLTNLRSKSMYLTRQRTA